MVMPTSIFSTTQQKVKYNTILLDNNACRMTAHVTAYETVQYVTVISLFRILLVYNNIYFDKLSDCNTIMSHVYSGVQVHYILNILIIMLAQHITNFYSLKSCMIHDWISYTTKLSRREDDSNDRDK